MDPRDFPSSWGKKLSTNSGKKARKPLENPPSGALVGGPPEAKPVSQLSQLPQINTARLREIFTSQDFLKNLKGLIEKDFQRGFPH
jgi:hypothetical protein